MLYKELSQLQKTLVIALAIAGVSGSSLLPTQALAQSLANNNGERVEQLEPSFLAQQLAERGRPHERQRRGAGSRVQNPAPPKDRGAPASGQREGAASRGPCPRVSKPLTALVPIIQANSAGKSQHSALANIPAGSVLGLTLTDHPTFWFYMPYPLTSSRPVEFVLLNDKGEELYKTLLAGAGTTPGVVGFKLPANVPPLEVNKRYNWVLSVYCDSSKSPEDTMFVSGWVERVTPDPMLKRQLEQSTAQELVGLYTNAGIWHEAVTTLAELRRQNPNNPTLRQEWDKLMQSVDLRAIAPEPITSMLTPQE
ncbi:MAG TPA: DUF928 domain-containing protein [Coleofasciculaceae cyanobacterium]